MARSIPTTAEDHSPLKDAVFHILLALGRERAYGYRVMQAVRELSDGRIRMGTGPFYRHLEKLLASGLVAEAARPKDDDPRRGAWYQLTPLGREVLALEGRRLGRLAAAARRLAPTPERGTP